VPAVESFISADGIHELFLFSEALGTFSGKKLTCYTVFDLCNNLGL
jgi:hypothetical protein